MHGDNKILSLKECYFYLPEFANWSRVFVLLYMQAHSSIAHLLKRNLMKLIDVVIDQDTRILSRIYPHITQRLRLNNEVGMDWVRRNDEQFPAARSAIL